MVRNVEGRKSAKTRSDSWYSRKELETFFSGQNITTNEHPEALSTSDAKGLLYPV